MTGKGKFMQTACRPMHVLTYKSRIKYRRKLSNLCLLNSLLTSQISGGSRYMLKPVFTCSSFLELESRGSCFVHVSFFLKHSTAS